MDSIPQRELHHRKGAVLGRVEAGEAVVITVAGRRVAERSPTPPRRRVGGSTLAKVWSGPPPFGLHDDLAR